MTRIGEGEHIPKDQEAHVVWGSVERREFLKIVGFREYDYEGLLRRLGPQYWGSQLGSFLNPTWHGGLSMRHHPPGPDRSSSYYKVTGLSSMPDF